MRAVMLSAVTLSACGYTLLPGVPLDWGQEWMPMHRLEIHESTCDGVERPLMSYVEISAPEGGRRNRDEALSVGWAVREDPSNSRITGAAYCLSAPEPTEEGYALDCPTRHWMIARNSQAASASDHADWTRHGFFAGPSSVVLHHLIEVGDCDERTECAEYTAHCSMRYTTWFGDWDD